MNWKKTLHLVRGLPGEGKSTLALTLVNGDRRKVVENDDYWYVPTNKDRIIGEVNNNAIYADDATDGPYIHERNNWNKERFEYKYDIALTHLAANWCGAEAFRRLRIWDTIAVPNTFMKREHLIGYIDQARKLQIQVKIHRPTNSWVNDSGECFKKNVHSVPMETIEKMKATWEDMTQQEVDILLNIPSELRSQSPSA
mgnify:CR=1 FL=1